MNQNQAPSFTISMNEPHSTSNTTQKSDNSSGGSSGDSGKPLEYILNRNETLDRENRSLMEEMAELKQKLDEEEDNNDKNDSRMVHMKGLTKNVVEAKNICEKIKNNSIKVHEIYKNMNLANEKFTSEFNKVCLINLSILFSIIFMFALFHSYTLLFTFLFLMAVNAGFFNKHFETINKNYVTKIDTLKNSIQNYETVIKELEIELKELKNATDFLNNHIDGI